MELRWTEKALSDLVRLHEYLASGKSPMTVRTIQLLISTPTSLVETPRIGERLDEYGSREIRRILVGHYEMRYEIVASTIFMLRLWRTCEDR